jgi:hypothetical protein
LYLTLLARLAVHPPGTEAVRRHLHVLSLVRVLLPFRHFDNPPVRPIRYFGEAAVKGFYLLTDRVIECARMGAVPDVILKWRLPFLEDDWRSCGLYAYLRQRDPEILYIGKAHGRSILQRLHAPDKYGLFDYLNRERGIFDIRVITARVEAVQNITKQLILDIESLLIPKIKPCANIQSSGNRGITRPDLRVVCEGRAWPCSQRTFVDSF